MPFGGLGGVLPFRLGDSIDGGVNAAQHARLCADLCAIGRVAPVFTLRVRITMSSGQTPLVLQYTGRNGNGIQFAPLVTYSNAGAVLVVEMGAAVNTNGYAVDVASSVSSNSLATAVDVTAGATKAVALLADRYSVSIAADSAGATHDFEIRVYGAFEAPSIGDYGGDLNKRDSVTEGNETYAWQWYRALQYADGSAYSKADDSVRSWELKAQARALGTSQRISEMLAASSTPGGSDALLSRWAAMLGVQEGALSRWRVRADCEFRFSDRNPPTDEYVSDNLSAILGTTFNTIATDPGTFTAPPLATYCPGYANGDAIYDMGPGVWPSSRAHLTIVLNQGSLSDADLADLMSREPFRWLDANLPATKTWSWSVSVPGGFLLGTSKLGMNSL